MSTVKQTCKIVTHNPSHFLFYLAPDGVVVNTIVSLHYNPNGSKPIPSSSSDQTDASNQRFPTFVFSLPTFDVTDPQLPTT